MSDLPPVPPIKVPPVPPKSEAFEIIEANKLALEDTGEYAPKKKKPSVKTEVILGNKPGLKVGSGKLAEMLGINVTTVQNWRNHGCPCEARTNGKGFEYDVGQVMKWRVQHEQDLTRASILDMRPAIENEMSIIEADRRKKQAEAQLAELKLATERSLVANIDDVMYNVSNALTSVRAGLMSLKSSLPGRLAHKDERYVEKALDKEIRNLLEKLSDYHHEYQERD